MNNLKEANIVELKRILVFTALDDVTIDVKHYEVPSVAEHLIMKNDI